MALFFTLLSAVGFCANAWSGGLFATAGDASGKQSPGLLPVIRAGEKQLGLYGGMASAYTRSGNLESATLVILPTGYVAPVLADGSLAVVPVAYFDKKNCGGREYLPTSLAGGGLLPFRGMVYRSLSTSGVAYLPKERASAPVQVSSRLILDPKTAVRCEPIEQTRALFLAEPNQAKITGLTQADNLGFIAIDVATPNPARHSAEKRQPDIKTEANEPAPAPQEECSPRCLKEAVGNGTCDIDCYVEACSFDSGDCAHVAPAELQRELANICAPGCRKDDIGDGFCDAACQTDACSNDGGDCEKGDGGGLD